MLVKQIFMYYSTHFIFGGGFIQDGKHMETIAKITDRTSVQFHGSGSIR